MITLFSIRRAALVCLCWAALVAPLFGSPAPSIEGESGEAAVAPEYGEFFEYHRERYAQATTQTEIEKEKKVVKPAWSSPGQIVPLGENREVVLKGVEEGETLQPSLDSGGVVEVEALGGGRFRLTAVSTGRAVLSLQSSKSRELPSLPIQVLPWAARWGTGPGQLRLHGSVDRARVEKVVRRWLSARTLLGASVELQAQSEKEANSWSVKATAMAPRAMTVQSDFTVSVPALPPSPLTPARLVVLSNHPERIVDDGILFERQVAVTPFRFMWHHRNDPDGPERLLVIELSNSSGSEREIELIWSSYGPSPDEIHVGHTAGLQYTVEANAGLTERYRLPANGSRTIEIRRVKPGQTMSGMAYIRDVSPVGSPLGVRVLAGQGEGELKRTPADIRDRGRTASGIFPAELTTFASHTVGGPFTFLEYGGEPYVTDVDGGHPSYGNFGTVFRTSLALHNPSDLPKEVFIGFSAPGGAARGILVVDSVIYDMPMGRPGDGVPVTSYLLNPHERRDVQIELFPQAGSNYPVRLIVRSAFERREKVELEPGQTFAPTIP